jgi:hypothetical protein
MEIGKIVKNGTIENIHSNLRIVFRGIDRNQIPGGIPNGPGRWRLERPAAAVVGQITVIFSPCRNLMVWTGKKRVVPQQFTMETFIPQFDLKGRNGFRRLKMQGWHIGNHRMMDVGMRVP